MKVLFVSVFYNREHCVDESVNSMLEQSYDDLHIVLWDDASTDNTFAELLKFKSERVSVLRSSTNQGFTKALIEAINSNESDLIAIHGSGDISHPYRIVRQVEYLIAHSDCGVCGCHVSFTSESVNLSGVSKRNDSSFKDEMRPPLTHGEVMFRRSLYNQVGGYREFFRMSQDYDLWMRFRDQGVDFGVVDEVLYSTVSRRDGVTGRYKQRYIQSFYAGIAHQCWQQRQFGEVDDVDMYGYDAWPFFKCGRLFSDRMFAVCRLAVEAEDYSFVFDAAYRSLLGGFTLRMFMLFIFATADRLVGKFAFLRLLRWCLRLRDQNRETG